MPEIPGTVSVTVFNAVSFQEIHRQISTVDEAPGIGVKTVASLDPVEKSRAFHISHRDDPAEIEEFITIHLIVKRKSVRSHEEPP